MSTSFVIILLLFLGILTATCASFCVLSYQQKNYRTAVFQAFLAGMNLVNLINVTIKALV